MAGWAAEPSARLGGSRRTRGGGRWPFAISRAPRRSPPSRALLGGVGLWLLWPALSLGAGRANYAGVRRRSVRRRDRRPDEPGGAAAAAALSRGRLDQFAALDPPRGAAAAVATVFRRALPVGRARAEVAAVVDLSAELPRPRRVARDTAARSRRAAPERPRCGRADDRGARGNAGRCWCAARSVMAAARRRSRSGWCGPAGWPSRCRARSSPRNGRGSHSARGTAGRQGGRRWLLMPGRPRIAAALLRRARDLAHAMSAALTLGGIAAVVFGFPGMWPRWLSWGLVEFWLAVAGCVRCRPVRGARARIDLARFDDAMRRLGLMPESKAGRPMDDRIGGALRLLELQGAMLLLQIVLVIHRYDAAAMIKRRAAPRDPGMSRRGLCPARLSPASCRNWRGCLPEAAPRVYFANHASHGDFVLIWTVLPHALRRTTRPVAAADYWGGGGCAASSASGCSTPFWSTARPRRASAIRSRRMAAALDAGRLADHLPRGHAQHRRRAAAAVQERALPPRPARPGASSSCRCGSTTSTRVMPKGEFLPVPLLCTVTFGAPLAARSRRGQDAVPRAQPRDATAGARAGPERRMSRRRADRRCSAGSSRARRRVR